MKKTIDVKIENGVAICKFVGLHYNNPFSIKRMLELSEALKKLDADPLVKAVILFGGKGNSFCAGGDFNEVRKFKGGDEVDYWIDVIADLYTTILSLSKPTIAAVEKYAIGIGFQVALCCDIRVANKNAVFEMPELKKGISCVFGGLMLEDFFTRGEMLNIVYLNHAIKAHRAKELKLISKLTEGEAIELAENVATSISLYPKVALVKSKKVINSNSIEVVERARREAKSAHRASFGDGSAQKEMDRVIGKHKK